MLNSAKNLSHNPITGNINPVFGKSTTAGLTSKVKGVINSGKSFADIVNVAKNLTGENWNNMSSAQKIASIASIVGFFA